MLEHIKHLQALDIQKEGVDAMEEVRYGRRIRAFRKLKRIQQVEFAKRIGISVTILGRIERGEKIPTDEQLQKIADELTYRCRGIKR